MKRQILLALRAVAAALVIAAVAFLVGCGSTTSSASSTPDGSVGDGAACVPSTAGGVGSNSAGYGCLGMNQDTPPDAAGSTSPAGFCDNGIRQLPPTCNSTVDALLARTPVDCASNNSTHAYHLDSSPTDPDSLAHRTAYICNLTDAVYWVADMDIDCDGRMSSQCPGTGVNMDPSYQNDTFVHVMDGSDGGAPLSSAADQYVVIPNDNYMDVTPGAVVAVIYGNKLTYAVFGDTGPPKIIGEGSVGLAEALGIPWSPASGGVLGNTVTFIAFTGAAAVPSNIEDRTAIETLGKSLTDKFLRDNPPAPADAFGDGGEGVLILGTTCGSNMNCAVGQVCCVTPGPVAADAGAGSFATASCVATSAACSEVALSCAGAGDCSGPGMQVCCAQGPLDSAGGSTACQTSCSGTQVCLSSSECPSGQKCRRLAGAAGIRTCVVPTDGGAPVDGGTAEDSGSADANGD